ncbi:MAG: CBS domain-containing protein [Candidatus Hydrothermarchaeales archaeon]
MIKAFNIMTKDVVSVSSNISPKEAASLMLEKGVGSLIVEKGGKTAGVVTNRDFVKLTAVDEEASRVGDIMSTPAIKVHADSELIEVLKVMANKKIKHVLVADGSQIMGVITLKDLVVSAPEFILSYVMEKLTDFDIPQL